MAIPTGTFQTYNQVGIREDLEDLIYNIAPMDTYVFNHIGKSKATTVTHEWQTDTLDAPSATNAWIEGDDFSGGAIAATIRSSVGPIFSGSMIHKSLLQIIPFRSSGGNLQRVRSLKFTRGVAAHPGKGNLIMPIKGS